MTAKEPPNKDSFGWILWLLLGDGQMDVAGTAEALKTTPKHLREILYEGGGTQEEVKKWIPIFEDLLPGGWARLKDEFEKRMWQLPADQAALDVLPNAAKQPKIANKWRETVGETLKKLRRIKGDKLLKNFLPKIRTEDLKQNWKKIEAGNTSIAVSLYQAAIEEACHIYGLSTKPSKPIAPIYRRLVRLKNQMT